MLKKFEMDSDDIESIRFFIEAIRLRKDKPFFIGMSKLARYFLRAVIEYDERNAYHRDIDGQIRIAPLMKKVIKCSERSKTFRKILRDFRKKIIMAYNLEELLAIFNIKREDICHPQNKILNGKYYEEALFSLGYHFHDFCCCCISNKIEINENDIWDIYNELFPNCFFSKKHTSRNPNEYQAKLLKKVYSVRHEAANLCVRIKRILRYYTANPS